MAFRNMPRLFEWFLNSTLFINFNFFYTTFYNLRVQCYLTLATLLFTVTKNQSFTHSIACLTFS